MRKMSLPKILGALSVVGILGGVYMGIDSKKPVPHGQALTPPSLSPFQFFLSGTGIVGPHDGDINVAAQVPGLVTKVLKDTGDVVKKGEALLLQDQRQPKAALKVAKAQWKAAQADLEKAKVALKNAQNQWALIQKIRDPRAISLSDKLTLEGAVNLAQKEKDAAAQKAMVAQQQMQEAKVILDQYTLRAPLDGAILQNNAGEGGYATPDAKQPLFIMGDLSKYNVTVSVDENDAWRFQKGKGAVAVLRGNASKTVALTFLYTEPYITPKQTLTGDNTELVDTRVFQIVYSYNPKDFPAIIGQEVDVYIETDQAPDGAVFGGPRELSK